MCQIVLWSWGGMDWAVTSSHVSCSMNWRHLTPEISWPLHLLEITWSPNWSWTCLRWRFLNRWQWNTGTISRAVLGPLSRKVLPVQDQGPKGQTQICCLWMAVAVAGVRSIFPQCGVLKNPMIDAHTRAEKRIQSKKQKIKDKGNLILIVNLITVCQGD